VVTLRPTLSAIPFDRSIEPRVGLEVDLVQEQGTGGVQMHGTRKVG